MIKIENDNLQNIADEYYSKLVAWIGIPKKNNKFMQIIKGNKNRYQKMLDFVYQGILNKELILSEPEKLDVHCKLFEKQFKTDIESYKHAKYKVRTSFGKFKSTMETLYKNFTALNGHWLMSQLDITTCPYCNRSYTFTVNAINKRTRPHFDHFLPKSKFPYLALSFYNLVPACPTCNALKGDKLITLNPYSIDSSDDNLRFEIPSPKPEDLSWIKDKSQINIVVKSPTGKADDNIKELGLKPLYEGHKDFIKEIIDKAQAYNATYYESLITSFKGLGKTHEEIDRFIWGSYIDIASHGQRPLSKLTRDILEQLKIK